MTVTTDTVYARVLRVISETLGADASQIVEEQTLVDDLGVDSLDVVVLTMAVEEEFGIGVMDEDGPQDLKTVGDIADFVRRVAAQQRVPLS